MTESTRLGLPYLQAAQAQKHVTHNEALERLDLLVQLTVQAFDAATPPGSPAEGQVWALGASPTGAWAGQGGKLAAWSQGGWLFVPPRSGWRAVEGTELRVFDGTAWVSPELGELQGVRLLGINATADAANRLALSSPASLFNHEGAGHQIKVNKAAAADTASLLFRTGFSGRAEMGTAGSDDFDIKVSPDGSTWNTALTADRASGRVTAPSRLSVAAGTLALPGLAVAGDDDSGLYAPATDQIALAAGGVQALLASTTALTAPLPVRLAPGTVDAPSLTSTAATGTGLWFPTGNTLAISNNGVETLRLNSANRVSIGTQGSSVGGAVARLAIGGTDQGSSAVSVGRFSADAEPVWLLLAKSRGAAATDVTAVAVNDNIGRITARAADGTGWVSAAQIDARATAVATGAVQAEWRFQTHDGTSLATRMTLTPAGRLGIGTGNPSTNLHVAGPVRVGSYTVATVPSASASGAGAEIHVSDETGGPTFAFSDGTNWRRKSDRAIISATPPTLGATLASSVTIAAADTWYTAVSLTLEAGTWLVMGYATLRRGATGAWKGSARLWDGTASLATTSQDATDAATSFLSLSIMARVTLTSSTAISLQGAASSVSTSTIHHQNALGDGGATAIHAIRIT